MLEVDRMLDLSAADYFKKWERKVNHRADPEEALSPLSFRGQAVSRRTLTLSCISLLGAEQG